DFMGDIGGEMLDRVHARPERFGHLAQHAREIADLVAPAGEIGDLLLAAALAAAHALGGLRQAMHGPRNGACEIERKKDRNTERGAKYLEDAEAHVAHSGVDLL